MSAVGSPLDGDEVGEEPCMDASNLVGLTQDAGVHGGRGE